MEINYDNLRKSISNNCNTIIEVLNESRAESGYMINEWNTGIIQDAVKSLRYDISFLNSCEGNEEIKSINVRLNSLL